MSLTIIRNTCLDDFIHSAISGKTKIIWIIFFQQTNNSPWSKIEELYFFDYLPINVTGSKWSLVSNQDKANNDMYLVVRIEHREVTDAQNDLVQKLLVWPVSAIPDQMRRNMSKLQRRSLGPQQILQNKTCTDDQACFIKRIPEENTHTHTWNSRAHDNWKFHKVQPSVRTSIYLLTHPALCVTILVNTST